MPFVRARKDTRPARGARHTPRPAIHKKNFALPPQKSKNPLDNAPKVCYNL